jgi:hypothetical protein
LKVTTKSAGDVAARFVLSDEAKPLLRPGLTPAQFLDALLDKQLNLDAMRLLAHALPKREAVWWACVCTRAMGGTALTAPLAAAVKSAEKWVNDPSEENRQAAMPAAEAAGYGTPAGCAALGAYFSGGSLGPPNVPAVPPPETLTGDAVAGGLMLAVVMTEPQKAPEKFRTVLAKGVEIANGKNLWK